MVIWNIAFKYIKSLLNNLAILPMLIGMPLFQMFIMTRVAAGAQETAVPAAGLVDLVLLSSTREISFVSLSASGTLVQFILITGIVAASMFITEREDNTLQRIFSAPVRKSTIIAGNILGQALIILTITAVILFFSSVVLGVNWGNSWISILVITLFLIYTSVSMGFLFSAIFKNAKMATGVMSFIVIVMAFLSGSLTLSNSFGMISNLTINKWAYGAYIKIMEGGSISDTSQNLAVLFMIGIMMNIAALGLFRRENFHE